MREYRVAENIIKSANFPIIDAGAQAGFFVLYCRALNSKTKIYAIEPEPNNAKVLAKHLKSNRISDVKIMQQALAAETGQREFYISKDTHNHSLISLAEEDLADKKVIPAISLTDFLRKNNLNKISLLKMDIEGAEYEVLAGLKMEDWQKINNILLEYHDLAEHKHEDLAELIRQRGFSLEIFPSHFDKKLGYMLGRNKKLK
ncbi:MAG: FkbM family methyltransferase [Candidatus Parcubacteria bacterium]|nr:FkbM family methyltransferase [Candidatus Parcubacteria bacterium]